MSGMVELEAAGATDVEVRWSLQTPTVLTTRVIMVSISLCFSNF